MQEANSDLRRMERNPALFKSINTNQYGKAKHSKDHNCSSCQPERKIRPVCKESGKEQDRRFERLYQVGYQKKVTPRWRIVNRQLLKMPKHKHRKIYSGSDPLLPVDVPVELGMYHVEWGKNNGVVGRVISINHENKTVRLESPKTRKQWNCEVKWAELRHTRRAQQKIEELSIKKI